MAFSSTALVAADGPRTPAKHEIATLARAIQALGAEIDPDEAARAARIAYEYPLQLAREYGVTDPPIRHNTKVNLGSRSRGLCWHWAHDMEARLKQENFRTLDLHRAIAPPRNLFRLEHSTVIVSRRGGTYDQGLVLDPWRKGWGALYWTPTRADPRYDWLPREIVLRDSRRGRGLRRALNAGG